MALLLVLPPSIGASAAYGTLNVSDPSFTAVYDLDTSYTHPDWSWDATNATFTIHSVLPGSYYFNPSYAFPHRTITIRYQNGASVHTLRVGDADVEIIGDGPSGSVLSGYFEAHYGKLSVSDANLRDIRLLARQNLSISNSTLSDHVRIASDADMEIRDTDIRSVVTDEIYIAATGLTIAGKTHIHVDAPTVYLFGTNRIRIDLDPGGYLDIAADRTNGTLQFGATNGHILLGAGNTVVIPDPYRIGPGAFGMETVLDSTGVAYHVRIENRGQVVTGVTVIPGEATATPGDNLAFTVIVTGTGDPSPDVLWQVSGATDPATTISQNGLLVVGDNELATSLTVTAISVLDNAMQGTALVTVVRAPAADIPLTDDPSPTIVLFSVLTLSAIPFVVPFRRKRRWKP